MTLSLEVNGHYLKSYAAAKMAPIPRGQVLRTFIHDLSYTPRNMAPMVLFQLAGVEESVRGDMSTIFARNATTSAFPFL